jgi:3-oxoacyl-[acyl-carrier protein] reductase
MVDTRDARGSEAIHHIGSVPTYPDLAGKVAVVTGGSSGIGAATCYALAANAVAVAVVARDRQRVEKMVTSLESRGCRAIGVSADMVRWDEVVRMRQEVESGLGPVDLVIPFAGGFGASTPAWEITDAEWHSVIESNLTSTFLVCKAFLPGMIERRRGAIVTMASNAGRMLDINLTASYAAAKAGVVMFTRHLAREVGPYGVRANCVAPATTITERVLRNTTPSRIKRLAELAPLKRIGLPQDTAMATLFLASESAAWLTGVTLDVAGGRVMM